MADIDVERKKTSIWPWIIGLLVLALLIWALMEMFESDEPEVVATDPVAAPVVMPDAAAPMDTAMPPAVSTYMTQCTEEQGTPSQDMGMEHQYTVNCFQQLREALNTLITREQVADTDVSARFDAYTSSVQQLQGSDPSATTHANTTRSAATTAAEVIAAMEGAWFAGNQQVQSAVSEVQPAAQGIQPNVQMLEQRDSVRTFFREAGDAVRMMAQNRSAIPPA